MVIYGVHADAKQFGEQFLTQPDRAVLQTHFNPLATIFGMFVVITFEKESRPSNKKTCDQSGNLYMNSKMTFGF